MVFDEWDADAKITYDRQLLDQLRLLILGPVGAGKTMLAHALGHEATRRGRSVHCESGEKLFRRLKGARLDDTHAAERCRLATVDLLIVDEFGLQAMDVSETSDTYEIVTTRHQAGSMVLTSNRDPAEWLGILADPLQRSERVRDVAGVNKSGAAPHPVARPAHEQVVAEGAGKEDREHDHGGLQTARGPGGSTKGLPDACQCLFSRRRGGGSSFVAQRGYPAGGA